jgi:N-hydroxyarylamine O-acetyltransferase
MARTMIRDDVLAYCDRIGCPTDLPTDLTTLTALQRAHLLSVPMDTLDLFESRPIPLEEAAFYRKIVLERRGAVCIELNGLFAALLRSLGFEVHLLSASVALSRGGYSPDFAHNVLVVSAGDERWLADVGYAGLSPLAPVRFGDAEHRESAWTYSLLRSGEHWAMSQRGADAGWRTLYRFTTEPRRLEDFAAAVELHRTAPESPFQQRRVVARSTPDGGKVVVSGSTVIVARDGREQRRVLEEPAEVEAQVRELLLAPRVNALS